MSKVVIVDDQKEFIRLISTTARKYYEREGIIYEEKCIAPVRNFCLI